MTRLSPVGTWSLDQTWATFTSGTFHGVTKGAEIQKSDDDLSRYTDLIEATQPDLVIETGTRAGGSALWFHASGLQVVTIDVAPQFTKSAGGPPYRGPGIEWIRGSSITDSVVNQVLPLLSGKRVMVSLDSDHHSAHVQAEIALWAQFVTPGCYLVVEDACFDFFDRAGFPERARVGGSKIPEFGGTLDALEKSGLAQSSQWDRDTFLEGITPISHSPTGFWRKSD